METEHSPGRSPGSEPAPEPVRVPGPTGDVEADDPATLDDWAGGGDPAAVAGSAGAGDPASAGDRAGANDPNAVDPEIAAEPNVVPVARWSRRGLVLRVVALVGLVLVGYYFVALWQVWSTGRSDQARRVDAIVVMGAAQYDGRPSPQLAGRLDHVVALWPEGLAPVVVVTGGNQPGDRFTEAEASARYLIERGVPDSVILLENSGSTTHESLEAVAEMLDTTGDRILIVTDPYHALRSRLTAQELGMTAYVSPTDTSVITGGDSVRRHVKEAGGVAVGRLIGFGRLSGLTD